MTTKSNGRKGSKKVRTGCITCKIRKVKCDEAKPACARCTKTGRTCNGYQATRRGKRASHDGLYADEMSLLVVLNTLPDFDSAEEQRAFQFFRYFTAPIFASDFDSGFWTALVLKLCHSELAVRHAVLAISSFHENLVQGASDASDELADKQVFALQQYNRAISILRDQMSDSDDYDPIVPLLMCLLFVCMEYMQRKEVESLNYLRQGRQMMQQFVDSRHIPGSQLYLIQQHIVPIYIRSGMTAFLFGANVMPVPESLNTFHEIPPAFSTIQEARHTFYSIMDRVLRSAFSARQSKYNLAIPPDIARRHAAEQQLILSNLSRWNAAFAVFMATKTDGNPSPPSALLLQIYYNAAIVWAGTSLAPMETDYDEYLHNFSAIIPLARAFLDATKRSPPKPQDIPQFGNKCAFAFDTHIIPPLYFTAVKCRHPLVRRAARDLLQKHHDRQENLWRASSIARVATRLIEIE
ncbi:hypothetical protein BJ170DRAFT_575602, partial [Xylariales sp. AK1849]